MKHFVFVKNVEGDTGISLGKVYTSNGDVWCDDDNFARQCPFKAGAQSRAYRKCLRELNLENYVLEAEKI